MYKVFCKLMGGVSQ